MRKTKPWWNQDVEKVDQANKDALKALLQNRLSSDLQSRYFEARQTAAQVVKMSKKRNNFKRSLVVGWIPTIIDKQTIYRKRGKNLNHNLYQEFN